jgi:hypothetical protein
MHSPIALILFCGVAAFAAPANALDSKSSLEGIVVDAVTKQPLRKAYLRITGEGWGTHAVSGPDGSFVASGLNPGLYWVHVERQGYLDCDCLSGVKISTGQKLTGVQLKLTKYGAISGRVVDPDGDPWPTGSVEVYRLGWKHGKPRLQQQDQTDVDDRGEFRIGKLPPGKYFVAARPATGRPPAVTETYQTSFFPGELDASAAAPVQIDSGREVTGIDIKLQSAPTFCVRGRINGLNVAEYNGEPASRRLSMGIYRASSLFEDWLDQQLTRKPDGTFEFCGVPSGSYNIRIASMSSGFTPSMAIAALGENAVQVNGHDVNDMVIEVAAPRELKPSVRLEGVDHPDLSSVTLELSSDDSSGASASADEGFVFPKIALASYQIRVRSRASSRYFVKSVRAGSMEFPGATLDLRRSGEAPVTITLSNKGAAIHGRLKTDSPDPTGATVTLIPDVLDPEQRERETSETTADQNGVFSIDNIPPGDYRLFAWQNLPEDVWQDPDFWSAMKDKGVSVKLSESEKKSIDLPLISAPDLAALLARMNIQ